MTDTVTPTAHHHTEHSTLNCASIRLCSLNHQCLSAQAPELHLTAHHQGHPSTKDKASSVSWAAKTGQGAAERRAAGRNVAYAGCQGHRTLREVSEVTVSLSFWQLARQKTLRCLGQVERAPNFEAHCLTHARARAVKAGSRRVFS